MPQSPLSRVLPTSMGESTKTVLLSRRQLRDPAGDGSACGPRPRPTRTAPRTVKNLVRSLLCGPWDLSAVGSGLPTGRGSRSKSPVMNSTTADTTDSGSSLAMALAAGRVTRNRYRRSGGPATRQGARSATRVRSSASSSTSPAAAAASPSRSACKVTGVGEHVQCLLKRFKIVRADQYRRWMTVARDRHPLVG